MRSNLLLAPLLVVGLLTACGDTKSGNRADPNAPTPPGVVPVRDVAALDSAASWVGDIPCADCKGIRTTVTLYPDGTFRSEGIYLETHGTGDTVFTDLGRWTHAESATRILLRGASGAPAQFAVDPDGSLRMLDLQGQTIASKLSYQLSGTMAPVSITHPTRLVGAFTYMADAAILVECGSGLQFPVDMSADYPALEQAYAKAGKAGRPVVVRLKGHLADRPAMDGAGTSRSLIVDSMDRINPEDGCAALRTQDQVAASSWRLVALEGETSALAVPESSKAGFEWNRREGRLIGNGGCNQFSAPAVLRGTTLVAGEATATEMFCEGAMDIESRFLAIVAGESGLRLQNDTLVWSRGPRDVARFVRP